MGQARLAEQIRIAEAERERGLGRALFAARSMGGRDVSGYSLWRTNDATAQRLHIGRRALSGFGHWRELDAVQFGERRFVSSSGGGGAGAVDYREPRQRVG